MRGLAGVNVTPAGDPTPARGSMVGEVRSLRKAPQTRPAPGARP